MTFDLIEEWGPAKHRADLLTDPDDTETQLRSGTLDPRDETGDRPDDN